MSRMIGGEPGRDHPHRPARRLLRRRAVLPRTTTRPAIYGATVRAVTDCAVLALPAAEFAAEFAPLVPDGRAPAGGHVPRACAAATSWSASGSGCSRWASCPPGLTHELNNPAAAAGRAADALRDRVAGMRHKLAMIADGKIAGAQLQKLVMAQEEFVKKVRHAPALSPLEASDREDELGDWLDDHGITGGWDLAPVFVAGGLGVERPGGRVAPRADAEHAGGRDPLAGLHGGDREPAAGDHRRHHADLRPGLRGQAVLADGPRAAPVRSTCTRAWTPRW